MPTIDNTKTVEDVCSWHQMKAERGELSTNTARLRATALRMLLAPLADDEPKTAEYMRANLDPIVRRWATLNPHYKADTATTYLSRAKAALDDYARWQENPTGFKFAEHAPRPKKTTVKTPEPPAVANNGVIPDAEWEPTPSGTIANTFRIGQGREIRFTIPEDLTIAEIARIAAHLATYSPEWSPGFSQTPMPPATAIVPAD